MHNNVESPIIIKSFAYVYSQDIAFVWSNSEDVNILALKEFACRTIMHNYGTYWARQKLSADNGNWLVDGIADYAAAKVIGERGFIKKELDAFAAEPPLEWHGHGASSQHAASYSFIKYLGEKYRDKVIDKILDNLGSGMISNHRCDSLENCSVLRAVYDVSFDINMKQYDLSFNTIIKKWQDYIKERYSQ